MSCKVGNQTNSQDPQAVNSRVFVGNLNTFQCSKTDVERMFQRYGRIAGISMHKGYAFIQFTNPFDARSACLGEDGRLLWGQTLDVNMVAEPKAHQVGRKRQNVAKTGNDWDYYYDSYYAQVGLPTPRLVPPMKRPRVHIPTNQPPRLPMSKSASPNRTLINNNNNNNNNTSSVSDLKTYSTPDILICGNCRELFSEIDHLIEHKKTYCKLRFTCKCHMLSGVHSNGKATEEPASLLCSQCKDSFHSAWDLMVHVQTAHMLNIYQLSAEMSSALGKEPVVAENGINSSLGNSMDTSNGASGPSMSNGLISKPNGNMSIMGDSVMDESNGQPRLSPTHLMERSGSMSSTTSTTSLVGCNSMSMGNSDTSLETLMTRSNNNNNNGLVMTTGDSGQQYAGTKANSIHLMNNNCTSTNNNLHGSVALSSSLNSFPIEASTQTLQMDNTTSTSLGGFVGNGSGTSTGSVTETQSNSAGNKLDEMCGLVSTIKSEAELAAKLSNGQVAGV